MRIDDGLLGGIIESLRLFHITARPDPGLLAHPGLVQQGAEGIALVAVGRQLIGRGQNAEVCLRDAQQQALLRPLVAALRRRGLKAGLLERAEGLKAPQRLGQIHAP